LSNGTLFSKHLAE